MKILCWNVRGINSSRKLSELKNFICKYDGNLLCLVETKVQEDKASRILKDHFLGWSFVSNHANDGSGRIWVLFKDHLRVNLLSSSAQGIHCHVSHTTHLEYIFLSCIYAANVPALRTALWDELLAIKDCMTSVPWLLVGDFNSVLSADEHSDHLNPSAADSDFISCVNSIEVTD